MVQFNKLQCFQKVKNLFKQNYWLQIHVQKQINVTVPWHWRITIHTDQGWKKRKKQQKRKEFIYTKISYLIKKMKKHKISQPRNYIHEPERKKTRQNFEKNQNTRDEDLPGVGTWLLCPEEETKRRVCKQIPLITKSLSSQAGEAGGHFNHGVISSSFHSREWCPFNVSGIYGCMYDYRHCPFCFKSNRKIPGVQ